MGKNGWVLWFPHLKIERWDTGIGYLLRLLGPAAGIERVSIRLERAGGWMLVTLSEACQGTEVRQTRPEIGSALFSSLDFAGSTRSRGIIRETGIRNDPI